MNDFDFNESGILIEEKIAIAVFTISMITIRNFTISGFLSILTLAIFSYFKGDLWKKKK